VVVLNHPAMVKFSGLLEDFTVSAHPVVPSKDAEDVARVLMDAPRVVPATGRAGSVPALEESVNCWTLQPVEYASPVEGERLPPLERVVMVGVDADVVSVAVGKGFPVQVLASATMVAVVEAHERVSGVTPVSTRFPLEKEFELLMMTAEKIVAAAMPGTRTSQRVPSPTVAKKRSGCRGLVQNEVGLFEWLCGTRDDQLSVVSGSLVGGAATIATYAIPPRPVGAGVGSHRTS